MNVGTPMADADVIVVGAGPGGSSAAYHLARQGLRVLLLERCTFPREKVCGDGLAPRAVQQVQAMGVDVTAAGWTVNRGVRFVGGRTRLELEWPVLLGAARFGLTRTRLDLDGLLAARAAAAGAKLFTGTRVTGPVLDCDGRIVGVTARLGGARSSQTFRSPVIIAATGVSARLPLSLGFQRRPKSPVGVAVRAYYQSISRGADPFLEVVLDVPTSGASPEIAPGYGWVFGLLAADVAVGALGEPAGPRREAALARYETELLARYASYYRLGRRFVKIMDNGPALKFGIKHVLRRPAMMRLVFKLMCHLDPDRPEKTDRGVAALRNLTGMIRTGLKRTCRPG